MNTSEMTSRNKTMIRFSRFGIAAIVALGLAGCASSFKADVSRFQSELPAPQGQSFAVVAEDPELAGGLEFALYADLVAAEMAELGYVEAASPEAATLLVRFDYDVDKGRERVRTTGGGFVGDPFFARRFGAFGGFGFRRSFAFGFYDPFLAGPQVRSFTVFTSDIDLKIDNAATGQRVFEGQAQAVSLRHMEGLSNPEIAEVMDISVRSVESLTARGKRTLADLLRPRKAELGYEDDG